MANQMGHYLGDKKVDLMADLMVGLMGKRWVRQKETCLVDQRVGQMECYLVDE
jgi:hypothetical protein